MNLNWLRTGSKKNQPAAGLRQKTGDLKLDFFKAETPPNNMFRTRTKTSISPASGQGTYLIPKIFLNSILQYARSTGTVQVNSL